MESFFGLPSHFNRFVADWFAAIRDAATAASPDKPTLRGMLAGVVVGSARGLAVSLKGVGEGLARCLQARIDQSTDSQTEE